MTEMNCKEKNYLFAQKRIIPKIKIEATFAQGVGKPRSRLIRVKKSI